MYIYHDGKLYIQKSTDSIVGVNLDSHGITEVKGTLTTLSKLTGAYKSLTSSEVKAKFNVVDGRVYKFPKQTKTKASEK